MKGENNEKVKCYVVETTVNEIDLVIEHLENLKERFNIEKMITI